MQSAIPTEPVLLLLVHPKGDSNERYIRLKPESYFVNDHGITRAALGAEQPWTQSWEGRSFDALIAEIDKAG